MASNTNKAVGQVVLDTETGTVHYIDSMDWRRAQYAGDGGPSTTDKSIEKFVQYLNEKDGKGTRYRVAELFIITRARNYAKSELSSKFTRFLKGAPDVRLQRAFDSMARNNHVHGTFQVSKIDGVWQIYDVGNKLQHLADSADVSWNDAREFVMAWLCSELGADIFSKVMFPPARASQPLHPSVEDEEDDERPEPKEGIDYHEN